MSEPKKKKKPEHIVRNGAVAASIWKRQAPSGFEYFDFSISRSWKSTNTGREGYSPNFFASNHEDLQKTIADAAEWIEVNTDHLKNAPELGKSSHVLI